MGFCSNCGAELQGGSIFCSNCGTKVYDDVQRGEGAYTQNIPWYILNQNINQEPNKNQEPNVKQESNIDQGPNIKQESNIDQEPNIKQDPNKYQDYIYEDPKVYKNPNPNDNTYQILNGYQNPNGNQNPNTYQNSNPYLNVYQNSNAYTNTSVNSYPNNNANMNYYPPKKGKKTGLIIGVVAASVFLLIALCAIIITFVSSRTPAYERPIKNLVKALDEGDYDKMIDCYPEYLKNSVEYQLGLYGDSDDAMDEMKDQLEEMYGDGLKISYKIKDKEKIFKSDLDNMEDNIENTYDKKVIIEEGFKLKVELTYEGENDENTAEVNMNVIRINSKWYLTNDFTEW